MSVKSKNRGRPCKCKPQENQEDKIDMLMISLEAAQEEVRCVIESHDKMARRFASEIAAANLAARQYKERAERAERAVESIKQFVNYLRFDMADNNPCG